MTWALVDDHANEHPKLLAAGAEAAWLWVCGLMYCRRQRGGRGFIPEPMVGMLYPVKAPKKLADRLVKVGLWVVTEGGYLVHEYAEWCDQGRRSTESSSRGDRRNRRMGDGPDVDGSRCPDNVRTPSGQTQGGLSGPDPDSPDPYRSDPIRSDPIGNVVVDLSGGSDRPARNDDDDGGTPPPAEADPDERITPCPLDLDRKVPPGLLDELADGYHVPRAAVERALAEFVAYWTLGPGSGKRRRNWPKQFRARCHDLAKRGELGSPPESRSRRAGPVSDVERNPHRHDADAEYGERIRKAPDPWGLSEVAS